MGHYLPYPPPPPPPSRSADRIVSIVVLVLTALMVAVGAFLGLMLVAFLDYCPPESCSAEGAILSVVGAVGVAVAVGVAGLVWTSVRLSHRSPGWPFAVGTLVLCALVLAGGFVAYDLAVGWD